MQAHSLFSVTKTPAELFRDEVNKYCTAQGIALTLTQNELAQLNLFMTSTIVTPEVGDKAMYDPLHFEIKRALARRFSFELLLQGGEAAHQKFIKEQSETARITLEDFTMLAEEAKALSEDVKIVIRVSCFLSINEQSKTMLVRYNLSNDSEEFLTQLADLLNKEDIKHLLPITQELTETQLQLLRKIYWPKMHLRGMVQTEGYDNITANFHQGIASGEFSHADFKAWKWRWITTSCGFAAGSGAKYYDTNIHFLTMLVSRELGKSFTTPNAYLDGYLLDRARLAGLTNKMLYPNEKYLLGHMVAFSNKVHILNPEQGDIVFHAYREYRGESQDEGTLATVYENIRKKPEAVAATYVTSVYSNSYDILCNEQIAGGARSVDASAAALKESTLFMFYLLAKLYDLPCEKRASMQKLAMITTLKPILAAWKKDHQSLELTINEQSEIVAQNKVVSHQHISKP